MSLTQLNKASDGFKSLSLSERKALSKVSCSAFLIFKSDCSLFICGESLVSWLSLGGLISGDIKVVKGKGGGYCEARISPSIFFRFILGRKELFDVHSVDYGYKVKIKCGVVA